jgi:hypothetical protein
VKLDCDLFHLVLPVTGTEPSVRKTRSHQCQLKVSRFINMVPYDPLCTGCILDEIQFNLIMIMKREVKIRLRPVKICETV